MGTVEAKVASADAPRERRTAERGRPAVHPWLRVRLADALVLQGPPVLGLVFGSRGAGWPGAAVLALFVAASLALIGHVFLFNDWSDAVADDRDANKAARPWSRVRMAVLCAVTGLASLSLFALVSPAALGLSAAIVALGLVYSWPRLGAKRVPVLGSTVHFVGGVIHFLLGYAVARPVDGAGVLISVFFALVFTAGHLNQEVRDRAWDSSSGIDTSAVRFGARRAFLASQVLFGLSYAHLALLAWLGLVPRPAAVLVLLCLPHLAAAIRAYRAGMGFRALVGLQSCYRAIYALIGLCLVTMVLLERS